MSSFGIEHRGHRWPWQSLALRGVMAGLLWAAGATRLLASPGASVVWLIALAALACGWATWPHSAAGQVGMVVVLGLWGLAGRGVVHSPWLLAAVVSLVGAHLAGVVAGLAPGSARPDPRLLWLWVRRWALLSLVGAGTWAAAGPLADAASSRTVWLAAGIVLSVAALALVPQLSRGREVSVGVDDPRRNPFRT